MVKMEFIPHISREILLGPLMSQSKKCIAVLWWKGVSISNVRLLEDQEINGQEQEDDIIHTPSLADNIVWQKGRDMVVWQVALYWWYLYKLGSRNILLKVTYNLWVSTVIDPLPTS